MEEKPQRDILTLELCIDVRPVGLCACAGTRRIDEVEELLIAERQQLLGRQAALINRLGDAAHGGLGRRCSLGDLALGQPLSQAGQDAANC